MFTKTDMRTIGILLIVIGIVILVFKGININTEKKVAEIGPIDKEKKEKRRIDWPMYAGGLATAAGIVLILADQKKA